MPQTVWNSLCERLRGEMDSEEFQLWMQPLRPLDKKGRVLHVGCPNSIHRNWVREHYLGAMEGAVRELEPEMSVRLDVLPSEMPKTRPLQMGLPSIGWHNPSLNRRFRFDTFVAGGGNEFACAAARAMAMGRDLFADSLFLVSGTGLGKSHLAQAVGHEVLSQRPQARVAYLTAEEFANQMVAAIRGKKMEEFKERFRTSCDVLLLEEVQFFAGKDKTQDELGFTLDALQNSGKKIIFTGSAPPDRIKNLKGHIASRLGGGITAPIEPPDHTTRVRILQRQAAALGAEVDGEVLGYLAQEITDDVRRLRSALSGLLAKSALTRRPLDLDLAAEVLGQMTTSLRRVTPELIRDVVAKIYGMPPEQLTGKARRKAVTRPRNVAMYLSRRHTDASYKAIGKVFNRDHATVMYGVGQIERALSQEPKLGQELSFLEQRLGLR